jgi:ABC-type phosphate transport system ATPase subunit
VHSYCVAQLILLLDKAGYWVEYAPTQRLFEQPNGPATKDYVSGRFG